MNIEDYRVPFATVVLISALLVASPALSKLLIYPRTEFFTELWILGPNHTAEDYPYNVSRNQNYSIFLGVGNHLGYCAYYVVEVKFRNETESAPSSFGSIKNRSPSSMPSLFNITAFVADETIWELPLTFSFSYELNGTAGQVRFYNMTLNDVVLNLKDYTTTLNSTENAFPGNLLFEAWLYNVSTSSFQYHARWVGLEFNMTSPGLS
jgi:uncharacterized membrane protein